MLFPVYTDYINADQIVCEVNSGVTIREAYGSNCPRAPAQRWVPASRAQFLIQYHSSQFLVHEPNKLTKTNQIYVQDCVFASSFLRNVCQLLGQVSIFLKKYSFLS